MTTVHIAVPLMLFASSTLMAFAWLGHIRFRTKSYWMALAVSWVLVLPEYLLNVAAFRWGKQVYEGGGMGAINLSASVLCMALVARFFLHEKLNTRQLLGFALMAVGVVLVLV